MLPTNRYAGPQPGPFQPHQYPCAVSHPQLGHHACIGPQFSRYPGASSPSSWKVWTDRGYMPHVNGDGLIQHVTYHLADSLPRKVVEELDAALKALPPQLRDAEKERRINAYMDAGYGSCLLKEPELAKLVQDTFLVFQGERYTLFEWCVMPNHVHVLFEPIKGWSMSKIIASWKSYTGRRISAWMKERGMGLPAGLKGNGPDRVWHREYWDRYVRDEAHFRAVTEFIRKNPVKAGLVMRPEEWEFSSAGYRKRR